MEEDIRSLRRQLRVLKIMVALSLLLSFVSFFLMMRVARQSMDASWQTIGMFQSLSKDQQSLRRDVERDRRERSQSTESGER